MSTNQNEYPDLTYPEVYKLQTVAIKLKDNPEYIKNSPYKDHIKTALHAIFQRSGNTKVSHDNLSDIDMEEETQYIYERTKELLNSGLDKKEELQVLKNATDLLDKLLQAKERARNQRYVKDLENKIIKITKILPEETRNELLVMLRED